ncbi:hypothetical protein DFH11DRAFT_1546112 [Phellopilus nigrolimitatus]|nr:hypothetical protein DFH11DRAFT_1546112 [Phellopilus nigrolimitatus]
MATDPTIERFLRTFFSITSNGSRSAAQADTRSPMFSANTERENSGSAPAPRKAVHCTPLSVVGLPYRTYGRATYNVLSSFLSHSRLRRVARREAHICLWNAAPIRVCATLIAHQGTWVLLALLAPYRRRGAALLPASASAYACTVSETCLRPPDSCSAPSLGNCRGYGAESESRWCSDGGILSISRVLARLMHYIRRGPLDLASLSFFTTPV